MLVTMTTVGYGGQEPKDYRGKAFAMLAAILGIIFASLMVAVITKALNVSPYQRY